MIQSQFKTRIRISIIGGLFSILLLSCNSSKSEKQTKQPNVIIILTDDQGWGDLSISGNSDINTPNIDKLAQNGAVFDRFYVSPVCSPTRAELLTGRHHVRSGVYSTSEGGERMDLDETTIANHFKQNGYQTAAYGKWHNGMQYPYHPNARGFDDFYGFCSGHWGNYFSPMLEHNGEVVKGDGFLPDDLTNKALSFIESNKNNPFLLYIPFNTPHSPMQVPDLWWDKYKNKDINNNHPNKDEENINHTKAAYALCENIDWNVGRVEQKLKELGLEENTIVVYLSDNGPNGRRWNGGMKGIKGSTDEGGVRSPLIIQWKGKITKGKNIEHIGSAIDLLPTLAELTGITLESTKPLDGKSLKPLLLEENSQWDDRYIVNHWKQRTSIRSQQFRLDAENRLFDMKNDPGQTEDIALKYPDQLEKMVRYKQRWKSEVLVELPSKDLRTTPVGHPNFKYTQLPARDAMAHGNIIRSNRWPNASFYTNWTSVNDSITWDVEILETGDYEAIVYYTCSEENIGSTIELRQGENSIQKKISNAHDPPLVGHEKDRVKRQESYVKDFIPLSLGMLELKKGIGTLSLKAIDLKGTQVMDFRLMMLNKIK